MAAVYLLGLIFAIGFVQGVPYHAQPAIIEDLRDAESTGSRIVAGWPAVEGQIPYQGSLRMVSAVGGVSSCGCSLIHHEWVLTAAHCLANRITFVIRFGLTNLTRPDTIVESTDKHIHPEYDEIRAGVQTADLALVGLDKPIAYTANIQPSRLMSRAQKNNDFSGERMVVSGFGRTDDLWNGGTASEILLWVLQRGVSNEDCLLWYPTSTVIKEQTICAGFYDNPSQSSCQGDSGGPLTFIDADGKPTQVGIVSFGSSAGCNSPFPSGYVRPGHYHDWYTEVTGIDFDWDSDAATTEPTTTSAPIETANPEIPSETPTTVAPIETTTPEVPTETTTAAPIETTTPEVITETTTTEVITETTTTEVITETTTTEVTTEPPSEEDSDSSSSSSSSEESSEEAREKVRFVN